MASNQKRVCLICGKEYRYCPYCDEYKDLPRWMFVFDTERCHTTFNVLSEYFEKKISKEQAYEKIKDFDFSDLETLVDEHDTEGLKEILAIKDAKKDQEQTKAVRNDKGVPKKMKH